MKKGYQLDPILGVYNFLGFREVLEEEIAKGPLPEIVLFVIDLRDFKRLNLLLGMEAVNQLLQEIFNTLKSIVPFNCTWGRFGPDLISFYFRIPSDKPLFNTIIKLAEKILFEFRKPFKVNGRLIKLDINIAISIYPYDAETAQELIEKTEKTLIKCKENYNRYLLYTKFIDEDMERENKALELISYAIENKKFVFYFQPYFYLKEEKLAGFEALIRIKGENGEIISPSKFIDVLERSPFLKEFENWSLQEIARIIDKWKKVFSFDFTISLNIAPNSFLDQEFLKNLVELLQNGYGKHLVLEVTERILIKEPRTLLTSFRIVKMADPSIKIALDDFGTGVTSLKSLIDYPIDVIKIDALYIKSMLEDTRSYIVVETLIELSKKLRLNVVAEGVETRPQFEKLKELSCDIVQGFLLARPMSEEEILEKFKNYSS